MQLSNVTLRAARELGLRPLLLLGFYRAQLKSGLVRRRTSSYGWSSKPLGYWLNKAYSGDPRSYVEERAQVRCEFFFDKNPSASNSTSTFDNRKIDAIKDRARKILAGNFPIFNSQNNELGFPPNWNSFAAHRSGASISAIDPNLHWTEYDLDAFPADVKFLWEPSRFGWAFILAQAFMLSNEPEYAESFWQLLDSWREQNPPNIGPQWISGQEVAIRLLGLNFCFHAFYPYLKKMPDRLATLAQTIAAHADRIPPTLMYSRAQGNNHLILEAAALYTTGLLFPEFHHSSSWKNLGKYWFTKAIKFQIFTDGGYIQHSVNYQRLALSASLWVIRLAEINRESFPEPIISSLQSMTDCMGSIIDPVSGRAPNFGHNDGALLFPQLQTAFHDYRPVLQLASMVLNDRKVFPPGPWDELLSWFGICVDDARPNQEFDLQQSVPGGVSTIESPQAPMRENTDFPQAGFYVLRGVESWGMLRCARFTTRPAHSDQLHFDLWWRGTNVLRDAGTYLYNAPEPWRNALAGSCAHNTLLVDGIEPMDRAGTFLWLNWAEAKVLLKKTSLEGKIDIIIARHNGYMRLGVTALRSIIRAGDRIWYVVDEILGGGIHSLRNGWLLPDLKWNYGDRILELSSESLSMRLETSGSNLSNALIRAGERLSGDVLVNNQNIMGWYSPTYGQKEPGLFLVSNVKGALPLRITTTIMLGDAERSELEVNLSPPGENEFSIQSVSFEGDRLEI